MAASSNSIPPGLNDRDNDLKYVSASSRKRERELSSGSAGRILSDPESQPNDSYPWHVLVPRQTISRSCSERSVGSPSTSLAFNSFSLNETPRSVASTSTLMSYRSARYDPDESIANHSLSTRSANCHSSLGRPIDSSFLAATNREAREPAPKRRRGLAGSIISTALSAALYTGAAALTAYSLWASWGRREDVEHQSFRPQESPEPDMGLVVSPTKGAVPQEAPNHDDPPPPYADGVEDDDSNSSPCRHLNSLKAHRIVVSPHRGKRRQTFQGSRAVRQSTPKKLLARASRNVDTPPPLFLRPSHRIGRDSTPMATDGDSSSDAGDMMRRFEDKMNALIA